MKIRLLMRYTAMVFAAVILLPSLYSCVSKQDAGHSGTDEASVCTRENERGDGKLARSTEGSLHTADSASSE